MKAYNQTFFYLIAVAESVRIHPQGITVTTPGGRATFTCYASSGDIASIRWRINDTWQDTLSGLEAGLTEFSNHTEIGSLTFVNIPQHLNNTHVRCVANFSSGTQLQTVGCDLVLQGGIDDQTACTFNVTHKT